MFVLLTQVWESGELLWLCFAEEGSVWVCLSRSIKRTFVSRTERQKCAPPSLQTSQSHWLISVVVAPPFTVSCLSVSGRQTALWHAQSTDLYLRSHTVSFMLFFRADLCAAPPGLSHWQRPGFVCLNRSHTTVLPFILSSHNPQKDHLRTVCSKLSFSKDWSEDALVYLMINTIVRPC